VTGDDEALRRTLPGRLALHARDQPARVALRQKRLGLWQELTWRDYHEHVQATARMLAELGVGPGDHVAILSDNRVEWLFADLGAQALGARSVGIYQTNPPADVAYVLQDSGSVVLFCEDQEQVDKAVAIAAETPAVRHVVVFEPRGTTDLGDPRLMPWDDFLARGRALAAAEPAGWFAARAAALDPAAPSMVVYTSGTTGPPKGAMISSRNVLDVAERFNEMMGFSPDDTVLSYLPLCHVAEKILSLFLPLTSGALVHFGEAMETVQADLREVSPTIFLGVPRIWEKMNASVTVKMQDASWLKRTLFRTFTRRGQAIAARRRAGRAGLADRLVWALGSLLVFRPLQQRLGLGRCRYALTGAAPISADLITWYHGVGIHVVEGYGQTECAGISHVNTPGDDRIGTVGKSLPLVEHRLADDGEILVRGPNVFCGYLNQPEATARTVDADGWLHTGDIGVVDADGYLTITGRKKEIIITAGGKNLSPEKIENALKTSPYLKEVVAIGDRRKFVAALVQLELDTVGNWATRRGLPYTSYADLAGKPAVVELVARAVEAGNELLAPVEQVKAFRILPKELSQDDGELTATQKVRRREVTAAFADLIEDMFR
jgi:long-chain acyl-CoA synthetase